MTIELRANVYKQPDRGYWIASARVHDSARPLQRITHISTPPALSWPEAMQAAYKLLRDLDAELMEEVHASRASRRAAKP